VPNLLLTGAGSPTGLCVYEGTLLPKIFHGQIIHCDAGPNVVRAYPVQPEGAGYSASIVPILTGSRDKWFRPSDVVVAPDGSLIVADWYDPGVGGHRQGDLDRGRLFRVAPPAASYHAPALDLSSARGAIAALLSPNRDAMYQGWIALEHLKPAAVPALAEVWKTASDPRHRARALHVLARLDPAGDWAARAAADADPDLRIVAIRIARDLDSGRLIGFLKPLASDASPAVRREVALAMRDLKSPGVPALWAALAQRHDGNDRWYLEALGIAAAGHDEACFQAWIEHVRGDWNTPAGRDIVWRSRAPQAVELLGKIIADPAVTAADRPRYFRAFDFHVGPAKQSTLSELLKVQGPHQDQVVALTLKHLDGLDLNTRPELKPIVARVLNNLRGTQEYVDLVDRLNLTDHNEALLAMIVAKPQDAASIEAARVLIRRKGASLLAAALADDARAASVARVLAVSGDKNLLDMVGPVIHDARRPLPIRSAALRAYAAGFQQQRDVLNWIKAGKLSPDLHAVAADLLFGSVKEDVRAEAAQYLQAPAAPGGKPLPPIAELARRAGNPDNGKAVYARSCVACHQIEGQGIDFGPALTEIGSKLPKEDLYVSILNPSAGISFGFEGWIIKLQDGNEMLGYIASETADTLTLKLMGGIPVKYAKSQIVSRTKQDQSLMTPGLHLAMTEQELVDLVEYLASLKKK
jgi:putative heme-binding domain-containing protein